MKAGSVALSQWIEGMIAVYNIVRHVTYPGLDLHTRNRASLCQFWKTGERDVLDAGSGNGYFSWLAYKSGARVVADRKSTRLNSSH